MGSSISRSILLKAGLAASALLFGSGMAMAQSTVTLDVAPTSTTLPDGQAVPMWGYACGAVSGGASCTAMNGAPQSVGIWQPPLITVPAGSLTVTLVNRLEFATGTGTNRIPTSLVIVGQLGGGLGESPQRMPSPEHAPQGTTWPGTPGGTGPDDTVFTPPRQVDRVRSFATEVPAAADGSSSQVLTWSDLRPGTYLIQSGTQPSIQHPMGLNGVLVVTPVDPSTTPPTPITTQAYGQTFDEDVALLLGDIDPVQNIAVDTAVRTAGFSDARVWSGQSGDCGDPAVHTCYPPAVNYNPLYYLVNGVSFDRTNLAASTQAILPSPATATTGRVLLRFVNGGLSAHTPSVVGARMTLLAEDGNRLPGLPRVQSELLLPPGKTHDVTIQPKQPPAAPGTYEPATYPVYDRMLSLSTNNQRDGGMQAYVSVAGGAASGAGSSGSQQSAVARADTYYLVAGIPLLVGDPTKGVIANDTGVYGATVLTAPSGPGSTLTLSPDGTFAYTPGAGVTADSFTYCANGAVAGATCSSGITATVTIAACTGTCLGGAPTAIGDSYNSNVATRIQISRPGVLGNDNDPSGFQLRAVLAGTGTCAGVQLNADGSFVATNAAATPCSFTYNAVNAQNTSSASATVSVTFLTPSNLAVNVVDAKDGSAITDYRWIIEEDLTVFIDPSVESAPGTPVRNVAINFHTSFTPVVAQGCTGPVSCETGQTLLGQSAVCDVGAGACRTDAIARTPVDPAQVALDPSKRYFISILTGDAADPIVYETRGHAMGGAQIAAGQTSVDVLVQPTPVQPAMISVFIFQDDHPLNGESDTGGGVDVLAPNEAGLGGFNIVLLDKVGHMGDAAGQITYDMFAMPVSNSLAGRIDPTTGYDACAISPDSTDGLVGQIVTCPRYEYDKTARRWTTVLSPLAGHALIANMYAGFYEVLAVAGADRIARGEQWLQTNTLDGTKGIEAFIKPSEPAYFQEFGPGGYHVAMGFANPSIIRSRKPSLCAAGGCNQNFYGQVTTTRLSRTPDQRTYSSGSYDSNSFTSCYVSLSYPDNADFDFAFCDGEGKFQFNNIPAGNFKITVLDQNNDLLVDGLSTPIRTGSAGPGSSATNPMEVPVMHWRTNLYGRVFLDQNGDGASQEDEPGLPLVPFNIRYRDGAYANFNNTDLAGYAGFNEVFPRMSWLVVDVDQARHKLTNVHVVYDAGGPADGTTTVADSSGQPVPCTSSDATSPCGGSAIASGFANTIESPTGHLPTELRVPGSRYCAAADCPASDPGFDPASGVGSTGRVDSGWASTQGWQGLLGNNGFVEFAMKPFLPSENGGIRGHVLYTPTRPFDDPALLVQLAWSPGIPSVQVNLYQKTVDDNGVEHLRLADTTTSTNWDDWAQGFRRDADGNLLTYTFADADGSHTGYIPNMNCPGQETDSPFYFTMLDGRFPLDESRELAARGRFKCYDGWSMLTQIQPAPYNGMYKFPSVVAKAGPSGQLPTGEPGRDWFLQLDPRTFKTNCTTCTSNPDDGTPMLPPGKYVVEVIVPPGYELVKEEDKNILLGDVYVAPAVTQFAGFGNIFILPDQAAVNAFYNPTNRIQSTTNNGHFPRREGDTGSVEVFWPCVGDKRIVPDLISLYPAAGQQAPFAGALKPLCDRKEVVLSDQMTALTKFYLFTSAHVASHFTGMITNDFASEFDPFSPQFGEKFAVPNVPVGVRDFSGREISRVYGDQWGIYNGMTSSSWTVFPPSPSGYIPNMMIMCMNDPGPILDTRPGSPTNGQMITDPAYNPAYSNFCYEIPYMPGETSYLDTPVVPTMSFAAGYNLPDCEYPDTTPAIKQVEGTLIPGTTSGRGPWVSAAGQTLTITALGDRPVLNHAYSGPNATAAPFSQKFITRHYGFGSAQGTVRIGGVPAAINSWSDTSIQVTVPSNVPPCAVQQRGQPAARCGQLEITAANGKASVDTVTVTVGGKAPTYVTPTSVTPAPALDTDTAFGRLESSKLQTAIDNAVPGDLIIVGPGTYRDNLLMWKPVRLQGVGAESVTINADAHPAGKLDAWRRQLNCLFGLSLEGRPLIDDGTYTADTYDRTGTYTCPASLQQRIDRIPAQTILGWDTTGNGNLAEMIQEPTLMGAYEGAGITALGRGIWIPANSSDFWGSTGEGPFPAGHRYLTNSNADCNSASLTRIDGRDYGTGNYLCNPSRIDGLSVINSSQGGGAIWAHAWNHNMEVSNNRVRSNHGTFTGGITIGPGEFPDPYLCDAEVIDGSTPLPFPNNCRANRNAAEPIGYQYGYGFNRQTRVHHNMVTGNASIGDALYSFTPSAAGGVSFAVGSDGYVMERNWVCGNLSSGDAGGVAHVGFINDGMIKNNAILFNQSQSATLPVNGGGVGVLGASPDRTITMPDGTTLECGSITDEDCPPGLPEGTGRNLTLDANLIMGNSAESGTGGGVRVQMVNGSDVLALPERPDLWNGVLMTNNVIANNAAGWDGGGVSMQDALKVRLINNTIISNDATASAGVLFKTLAAPMASVPPPNCDPGTQPGATCPPDVNNTSTNQPAGVVTMQNTPNMTAALADLPTLPGPGGRKLDCPNGHGYVGASCERVSLPMLANNVLWKNRAFHVEVGDLGTGQQNQQSVVTLVPSLNQTFTGMCATLGTANGAPGSGGPVNYWDIGVRGDLSGPTGHESGYRMFPQYSILTSGDYATANNVLGSDPAVLADYCNGSRLPPEGGGTFAGYNAPAGRAETTGLYPVFALNQAVVAATVDEGNNWINLTFGPLSLSNPASYTGPNTALPPLGDNRLSSGSPAIDQIPPGIALVQGAPDHDFLGNPRGTSGNWFDIGAVEYVAAAGVAASVSPGTLDLGSVAPGGTTAVQALTLHNNSTTGMSGINVTVAGTGFSRSGGTCGTTLAANSTCTIGIVYTAPGAATPGPAVGTASVTATGVTVENSPVALTATVASSPAALTASAAP